MSPAGFRGGMESPVQNKGNAKLFGWLFRRRAQEAGDVELTLVCEPDPAPAAKAPLEAHYVLGERVLGKGASGNVIEAECRFTGTRVAVKSYKKDEMGTRRMQYVKSELQIHASLTHPHVVKLVNVYETDTVVHIVMEQLCGGELLDRVLSHGRFSETRAARIAVQLLQTLAHLHSRGIVHRDVKMQNLVFDQRGSNNVKLIDFGFAATLEPHEKLLQMCGTLGYVAPEVAAGQFYDEKVDVWSAGAVIYNMLTGNALYGGSEQEVLRKSRRGQVDFSRRFWGLRDEPKDFLRCLLTVDQVERPSIFEALEHPWLYSRAPKDVTAAMADLRQAGSLKGLDVRHTKEGSNISRKLSLESNALCWPAAPDNSQ